MATLPSFYSVQGFDVELGPPAKFLAIHFATTVAVGDLIIVWTQNGTGAPTDTVGNSYTEVVPGTGVYVSHITTQIVPGSADYISVNADVAIIAGVRAGTYRWPDYLGAYASGSGSLTAGLGASWGDTTAARFPVRAHLVSLIWTRAPASGDTATLLGVTPTGVTGFQAGQLGRTS